jgi:hypothetical protein
MEGHEMPDPGASTAIHNQRLRWGFGVFAAIALFFLWQEHRAHLFGALPWLLLLACPVVHFFMHRGHGSHGEKHGEHEHGGHGAAETEKP